MTLTEEMPLRSPETALGATEPHSPVREHAAGLSRTGCWTWKGKPEHWMEQAAIAYVEAGGHVKPWSQIELTCKTRHCLNHKHMLIHAPVKLRYPNGVCIYCGSVAGTQDHLMPRADSGDAGRKHVLTVPACGQCNSIIGDAHAPCITDRRRIAKAGLRKRLSRHLKYRAYSDDEIAEFGPGLRSAVLEGRSQKLRAEARLQWPADPTYDIRYLEQSGIEDPYALGLIKEES